MWTSDPYTELRIANDRHRERIAAASLMRAASSGQPRRHPLAGFRRAAERLRLHIATPRRRVQEQLAYPSPSDLPDAAVARCEFGC